MDPVYFTIEVGKVTHNQPFWDESIQETKRENELQDDPFICWYEI